MKFIGGHLHQNRCLETWVDVEASLKNAGAWALQLEETQGKI